MPKGLRSVERGPLACAGNDHRSVDRVRNQLLARDGRGGDPSSMLCVLRATRPSGVSAALIELMISWASASSLSLAMGTAWEARSRPAGSSSGTRSLDAIARSAV